MKWSLFLVVRELMLQGFCIFSAIRITLFQILSGGRIGRLIADGLKEEGMNVWNYLINNESRINYAYVDEFRGRVFMINEQGPVIVENEKKDYLNKLTEWLEEGQILVLSGSTTRGFTNEDIREIIRISRRKKDVYCS